MSYTFLNDVTYTDGEERPLQALQTTLSFAVDDWGDSRAQAWAWGIINGWDEESEQEFMERFGWSADSVERLRRLHERFETLVASSQGEGPQ